MTLRDDLLGVWARVYTELPTEELEDLQHRADRGGRTARDAKLDLAEEIVSRYHGPAEARRARQDFVSVFSQRRTPQHVPDLAVACSESTLLDLVHRARPDLTRSAVRRLITEGGVRLNNRPIADPLVSVVVEPGDLLQAGKRRWFAISDATGNGI